MIDMYQVAEGKTMTENELHYEYLAHSHMASGLRSFSDYIEYRKTHPVEVLVVVPPQPSIWKRIFGKK